MNEICILSKDNKSVRITGEMREELEQYLGEKVIFADDSRYHLKFLPNETRPSVVVECHSVEDMVFALKFARKHNLITAIRNGELSILGDQIVDSCLLIDIPQFVDFGEMSFADFGVEMV